MAGNIIQEWGDLPTTTMFTGKDIFVKRVFFVSVSHRVILIQGRDFSSASFFFLTMSF
jgi:TfoX/Sxy family transcriptional regulator of competence genes